MAGNTKEIPTTTIKTNGEYNGNWNISDRTLGILPKGVDALTKSCAAEHTASSQFRSCSDLDHVNQWISHFEPAEFREFLGSGQAGYRFSTGSVDTTHLCSSLEHVRSSVNGVGELVTASPVFFPNNMDRSRISSVSEVPSFPVSGQSNGFPVDAGTSLKRRKSSFQITSITAPDRSKLSSAELDSWDSVEDMLSAADDTGSDTQDTSQSTIDYNENTATSLDAVTFPNESCSMSMFLSRNANVAVDGTKLAFDTAPYGILIQDCSPSASALKSVLPGGTDKSKDPHLNAPSSGASSNEIFDSFKASESTSECNKPTCPISEIHSRFKIVKILNRIRGRWKCTDCIGLPMSIAECSTPKLTCTSETKKIIRDDDSIPFVCPQEASGLLPHPAAESLFAGSYNLSTLQGIESRLPVVGCDEIKLFQANQSNLEGGDSTPSDTYVLGLVPLSADVSRSTTDAANAREQSLKSNNIVVFLPQINHHGDETTNTPLSAITVSSRAFSSESLERMEERLEIDEGFATCSEISTRPGSGTAIDSAAVKSAGSFELDNKIEQAMDLVKTHLMFAVHEEVELLKLKIKELMTKNHRLEYENNLLRVSADPQLLSDLGSHLPQVPPRTGPS